MSLDSWKQEFYPIDAAEAAKHGRMAAAQHSKRKWEGLRPDNLARHKVRLDDYCVIGGRSRLEIDAQSCSLCVLNSEDHEANCDTCDLAIVRGLVSCIDVRRGETKSPFDWLPNPEPMIMWIDRAIDLISRETK